MGELSPWHVLLVVIIALVMIGPGKLPELGAALGKSIREFRKAASEAEESTPLDTTPVAPPVSPVARAESAPPGEPVGPAVPIEQPPKA